LQKRAVRLTDIITSITNFKPHFKKFNIMTVHRVCVKFFYILKCIYVDSELIQCFIHMTKGIKSRFINYRL